MDITSSAGKTLGKEEFLKLFTNQLKYQDPLNPLENTEFSAQLAQFSSLEQLFNINKGLEQMISFQGSMNNGMTVGFIGKTVEAADGVSGRVVGIEFDQNVATLVLESGQKYPIGQITKIYETTTKEA